MASSEFLPNATPLQFIDNNFVKGIEEVLEAEDTQSLTEFETGTLGFYGLNDNSAVKFKETKHEDEPIEDMLRANSIETSNHSQKSTHYKRVNKNDETNKKPKKSKKQSNDKKNAMAIIGSGLA